MKVTETEALLSRLVRKHGSDACGRCHPGYGREQDTLCDRCADVFALMAEFRKLQERNVAAYRRGLEDAANKAEEYCRHATRLCAPHFEEVCPACLAAAAIRKLGEDA